MSIKQVRFNYFTINLVPTDIPTAMQGRDPAAPWDMRELLDFMAVPNNEIDCVVNVGRYLAEFDRHTSIIDGREGVYSFQIGKLRETNIPSKKRIGDNKEDLGLADDEYIGEFVTIVFDERNFTVAVQSNLYSLNVSQVETFLTELRNRHKRLIGQDDPIPLIVELRPILDTTKVDTIGNSDIFRKITIKGSSIMADSLANNGSLEEISALIGRARGVNFELTLSVGNAPKTETLDSEVIQEVIEGFRNADNKPNVVIAAREDEESPIDIVNLLSPRLSSIVKLHVETRRGIGYEYIHNEFMEEYRLKRNEITRILQPIGD